MGRHIDREHALSLLLTRIVHLGGKTLLSHYDGSHTKFEVTCEFGHSWGATAAGIYRGRWCPVCANKLRSANARNCSYSLEEMKQLARRNNGKFLSPLYVNVKAHYMWECHEGHTWPATAAAIIQGSWCPHCAGVAPHTIEDMRNFAAQAGGLCLSAEYINNRTPMNWSCASGHSFWALPLSVVAGNWCPHCAGNVRGSLEAVNRLAYPLGGRCISPAYTNNGTKLEFLCAEGHRFFKRPHDLLKGSWCRECGKGTH